MVCVHRQIEVLGILTVLAVRVFYFGARKCTTVGVRYSVFDQSFDYFSVLDFQESV